MIRQVNEKKAKGNVDDVHLLFKLSPALYMDIRKLLMYPNGPSIQITTAELANVVNGQEDISLPDWATDYEFEVELESFIENYLIVSICWKCDSVISFFNNSVLGELIALALIKVQQAEKIPCPHCKSLRIAFYMSKVLTIGKKILPLDKNEFVDEQEYHMNFHKGTVPKHISKNEEHLDKLLRENYDISNKNKSDIFEISNETLYILSKLFAKTLLEWEDNPILLKPDPNVLENFRERRFISLRADVPDNKPSVLGHIWHMVKGIIYDNYPEFCDVAIGMAITKGISASAHFGDLEEMAIVVEMGLFLKLPRLNHLLSLMHDTDMLLNSDNRPNWTIDEIVSNLIADLNDKPINPELCNKIPKLNYHTQAEFLRSNIITKSQIMFIILHELGHLADWKTSPKIAHHSIKDPLERTSAIEEWADNWAMTLILKRGESFHIPWLQYRSIFWLFEYWYLLDSVFQDANAMNCSSRARWDHIESLIRSHSEHDNIEQLNIDSIRTIFDININKNEQYNAKNKTN